MDDAALETTEVEPAAVAPAPQPAPPAPEPAEAPAIDMSKAVVVLRGTGAAGGQVIVCEDTTSDTASYQADGTSYLRWPTAAGKGLDEDGKLPAPLDFKVDPSKTVLTFGADVTQGLFGGLSFRPGTLNALPAAGLAWAGMNLAYQQGARDITIVGLTDAEKASIQPFVDALLAKRGVETKSPLEQTIPSDFALTIA